MAINSEYDHHHGVRFTYFFIVLLYLDLLTFLMLTFCNAVVAGRVI